MILDILKKPVQKMAFQEELLQKYGDTVRKNVRRLHEIEYVLQRFSKVCDQGE